MKKINPAIPEMCDLVFRRSPQLNTLRGEVYQYAKTVGKWYKAEGLHGLKRAKLLFSFLTQFAMEENPLPLSFLKSSGPNGVPVLLTKACNLLSKNLKNREFQTAILSAYGIHNLYVTTVTDSDRSAALSTIVPVFHTPPHLTAEFSKFMQHLVKGDSVWKKRLASLGKGLSSFYNEGQVPLAKKGPNGLPSIVGAHRDDYAFNLVGNAPLKESLINLSDAIDECACPSGTYATQYKNAGLSQHPRLSGKTPQKVVERLNVGKLAFIPEKGGKTRTVAIPCYQAQATLLPLHDSLMGCLRGIPQDCTYNQSSGVEMLRKVCKDELYCASFDQTAVTDLFPRVLQEVVLKVCYGEDISSRWSEYISEQTFVVQFDHLPTRRIRYGTGQPMGLYSSWPLMALSHHLLIQWCAWRVGKFPFVNYEILGDDVFIYMHKVVADEYVRVTKLMGMKINVQKSHLPDPNSDRPAVGEFAKRLVVSGDEISPISYNQLKSSRNLGQELIIFDLFGRLLKSGIPFKRKNAVLFIKTHRPKMRTLLGVLLNMPQSFGGVGFRGSETLRSVLSGGTLPSVASVYQAMKLVDEDRAKSKNILPEKLRKVLVEEVSLLGSHPVIEFFRTTKGGLDAPFAGYKNLKSKPLASVGPKARSRTKYGNYLLEVTDKLAACVAGVAQVGKRRATPLRMTMSDVDLLAERLKATTSMIYAFELAEIIQRDQETPKDLGDKFLRVDRFS